MILFEAYECREAWLVVSEQFLPVKSVSPVCSGQYSVDPSFSPGSPSTQKLMVSRLRLRLGLARYGSGVSLKVNLNQVGLTKYGGF